MSGGAVVSLRPVGEQNSLILERRYRSAVDELHEAYPEGCWSHLERVLTSYGQLCADLGQAGGAA